MSDEAVRRPLLDRQTWARLTGVLTELADVPVDELGDRLLDRFRTGRVDDDVALLAVRCHRGELRCSRFVGTSAGLDPLGARRPRTFVDGCRTAPALSRARYVGPSPP